MDAELQDMLGEIEESTAMDEVFVIMPDGSLKALADFTDADYELLGIEDDDPDEIDRGEGGE